MSLAFADTLHVRLMYAVNVSVVLSTPSTAMVERHKIAKELLDRINHLFLIERGLNKSTPEERHVERQKKSLPVVEDLRNWLLGIKDEVIPKSLLGTAVTYGLNQWEKLTRFLQDGRIELSNNLDTTDTAAIEALLPWNIKLPK